MRSAPYRNGVVALGMCLLLLACYGCTGERSDGSVDGEVEEESEGEEAEQAVLVAADVIGRGPIEAVVRSSASLETEENVKVVAEAARHVVDLLVEEGDRVEKGTLLLRLRDDVQRSNLDKATASHRQAEREFDRQKRLFERELSSEQAYNSALFDHDQSKIALADAKRELGYAQVRTPIAGTVTARLVNIGDQVQIGQHLFDVVDFESIVARVYVPEKHLAKLSTGLEARVTTHSSSETFAGVVTKKAPIVDARSGTVKITVGLRGPTPLLPGMYVDVELITEVKDDAVLVPKRALIYDNDQVFVYRLAGNVVERVKVEPMLSNEQFIEPAAGIAAGDSVIVAGQAGLKDGALVKLASDADES